MTQPPHSLDQDDRDEFPDEPESERVHADDDIDRADGAAGEEGIARHASADTMAAPTASRLTSARSQRSFLTARWRETCAVASGVSVISVGRHPVAPNRA